MIFTYLEKIIYIQSYVAILKILFIKLCYCGSKHWSLIDTETDFRQYLPSFLNNVNKIIVIHNMRVKWIIPAK